MRAGEPGCLDSVPAPPPVSCGVARIVPVKLLAKCARKLLGFCKSQISGAGGDRARAVGWHEGLASPRQCRVRGTDNPAMRRVASGIAGPVARRARDLLRDRAWRRVPTLGISRRVRAPAVARAGAEALQAPPARRGALGTHRRAAANGAVLRTRPPGTVRRRGRRDDVAADQKATSLPRRVRGSMPARVRPRVPPRAPPRARRHRTLLREHPKRRVGTFVVPGERNGTPDD